ncbi:MAG: hypothetical protein IJO91_00195 [Oscillospiraceae bacterium]|nr:hypothetical protein [Oscillospiraceae bacterium]
MMRKVGSVLCFVVAIASVIFAMFAGDAKGGWFVGLAMFRVVRDGTFMGMIGNIFGVLVTFLGFAAAGFFGMIYKHDKMTLIWSGGMTALCLLSMIISICSGTFTIGDILIIVPSALVLVSLFTSNE